MTKVVANSESEQDFVTAQQSVVSMQDTHEPPSPTVFVGTVSGDFVQVTVDVMLPSMAFRQFYRNLKHAEHGAPSQCYIMPAFVNSTTFSKTVQWLEYQKGKPEPASRQWYTFDDFEKQFFTTSVEQVSQLIQVAEALDIRKLFLYGCQAIAERIRGKSAEEIKTILGIRSRPKPAEEPKKELIWIDPPVDDEDI
ncbi:Suppressor of kinetochore protein 1 [Aphelenchoides avenae]|nr:Suppressor of kinetochore protein 1 [Aphelenchus avenae]